MYVPQRFERAHGTDQRALLATVIATEIPQLAITKTQSLLGFRNSFRQLGQIRLEESGEI
jgi:hypothetical protein